MNAKSGLGWYHGWNIVAVAALACVAANAMPINAMSLFLRDWSADLHVPVSRLQLALFGLGVSSALLSPFAGILADKWPARILFAIGLGVLALVFLGISYMTSTWQLFALYALPLPIAICLATLLTSNAVVSRWFVRRLGLALAITTVGLGLGGVVLPIIIAQFMPELGWRIIWRIAAIIIAVVLVPLALAVVRDRPRERDGTYYLTSEGQRSAARQGHGHGRTTGEGSTLRWRTILASRNFWLLVIAYLPMLAVYGGVGQNLAPMAVSHGISERTAGTLVAVFNGSQLAFSLLAGVLSDRFGNRFPLAGLAITTAVGGVIAALAGSLPALALGAALAAIGNSFWPLVAAALAREFGAGGVGRAFGMVSFFLPLIALSPFIAAKTQEATGSYTPALLGMAGLALLAGLLVALFMRERNGASISLDGDPAEHAAVPAT
jgi:MFS family permease